MSQMGVLFPTEWKVIIQPCSKPPISYKDMNETRWFDWGLKLVANIRSFRKTSVLTISASLTHTHIYSVSTTIFGECHIFGAGYPIQWNTGKSVLRHSFQSSPINHQPSIPLKPTIKLTIIYQPKNTISPWSEQVKKPCKKPRNPGSIRHRVAKLRCQGRKAQMCEAANERGQVHLGMETRTTSWLGIFNHIIINGGFLYFFVSILVCFNTEWCSNVITVLNIGEWHNGANTWD